MWLYIRDEKCFFVKKSFINSTVEKKGGGLNIHTLMVVGIILSQIILLSSIDNYIIYFINLF